VASSTSIASRRRWQVNTSLLLLGLLPVSVVEVAGLAVASATPTVVAAGAAISLPAIALATASATAAASRAVLAVGGATASLGVATTWLLLLL